MDNRLKELCAMRAFQWVYETVEEDDKVLELLGFDNFSDFYTFSQSEKFIDMVDYLAGRGIEDDAVALYSEDYTMGERDALNLMYTFASQIIDDVKNI